MERILANIITQRLFVPDEHASCPRQTMLIVTGGKWKADILGHLHENVLRLGALK